MNGEPSESDTIAAIATPPGRGGVGIVRISGPVTVAIAKHIIGKIPDPRRAIYTVFLDEQNDPIDEGIAIYFPSPNSYTGEDVLELQAHGSPVVMDLILKRILSLGARLAQPGEFSERAFLNDKIDLTQAEAVADLIESQTIQSARCAMRSLQGAFSKEVHKLVESLIAYRTYVEAALDFPEEEIDFLAEESLVNQLQKLRLQLTELSEKTLQGSLLREGIKIVITGRPNAGKSSLLNRLSGDDAAIVSSIPGTTRDVMHREIHLDGIPLRLIDTAGLHTTSNPIEKEGIRRAKKEIISADLVILLIDAEFGYQSQEQEIDREFSKDVTLLKVWNKMDLYTKFFPEQDNVVTISAKTGLGLDELRKKIKETIGIKSFEEDVFIARRRHLQALDKSQVALDLTYDHLICGGSGELMAEELRIAQYALGTITGEFTSEDLLNRIFSNFCIGK